ncbi:histidine--tRNA ligase [Candidatus Saccharibacteria bacterium]|nr:histidine--tRNA ligase [Candidatus Saccharibacteria bacterium]MCL1962857.1 histidine--tRNA ligase [Candidatus Saccharibacteria bacterium]
MLSLQSYKGTRDIYPEDMRLRNYIFGKWRKVIESFGYEEYDAPLLEPIEIYAAKSGTEIVNDQTYTFTDRGDRTVAIRPEMTPSVSRMVAARRQEMPMPARLYSISNFMRYERPQKGREREFWQLNFDLFGVDGIAADAEIITIADKILREFGANESMFTIRINDRRLTNYIMREYLGLDENQTNLMIKLFDRREKMPEKDFLEQAAEIVQNESKNDTTNVTTLLIKVRQITEMRDLDELVQNVTTNVTKNETICDLKNLFEILKNRGIKSAKFDPTLMRGFDYYTGTVFEVFDESPENRRGMFGGGRYDGLIGLFGVEPLPVVGVAPGETTMIEFLKAHNLLPELKPSTKIVVIPMGEVDAGSVADELRVRNINVSVDFSDRKTDKKIKGAVKSGVQYALFVGEDEIANKKFSLKNVATGEQQILTIDKIAQIL